MKSCLGTLDLVRISYAVVSFELVNDGGTCTGDPRVGTQRSLQALLLYLRRAAYSACGIRQRED